MDCNAQKERGKLSQSSASSNLVGLEHILTYTLTQYIHKPLHVLYEKGLTTSGGGSSRGRLSNRGDRR